VIRRKPERIHDGRTRRRGDARSGQALVEFGLVIGLFLLVIGGLVQFGIILWSQNAINDVSRDTARWAVTQSGSPCDSTTSRSAVATTANQLARRAMLVSYTSWSTASTISSLGAEGVGVDWQRADGQPEFATDCPPSDSAAVWTIRVKVNHVVPIFIPFLRFIAPACASSGFCLQTTTELRMEPKKP
jgi:Flp pilus assembly protein TadG